ncbi:hypothetical protein A2954_02805 [Candidatus Roizmanbacteria bacterium RIFCSPLOWO2_01_FULL_37_12]|uniref:Spore coat protein n=1 Tax=Candidatus Roizmanbacteria bacterium RIFCSPLOWO2_01_FULL_37_12 TaxID=1802056 RepID=A0A1F7IAJ4_9BACT|nr:MAG: hypothetical protein A3D76_03600 [Candidatus Roizmanbacteria bacterium RIFCSPHIGHO2_02_FULL_37_9b]OGK40384.1 MAG: hypothetical protein A2954_02805 [Candidatus Roizmanbacteria bacterium RIFCSPLOWO2_01_FULL_37_12]
MIEGVKTISIKVHTGEDGTFEELLRLDQKGILRSFPDFQLRQISRSQLLPGAVKAWHVHFNQEDIWYVPPENHMLLGLWDLRKDSPTSDLKMRITLGAGNSRLVYIPRGVAHGILNVNNYTGTIFYFMNNEFNPDKPDEQRLPWDALGAEFWQPVKG